jgi:hypothetical protein
MSSWPLPHYRKCNDRVREALAAGFHPRKSESAKVSFLSVGLLHCMSRLVCRLSNAGYDNAIHGLMRPAFEKRQGTKSREVREKRCRGRYGDLMSAPASMAGATPARGDLRVCTQASLGAENWLSGDAQSASTGARRIDRRDWAERDRRWGAASGSELERRNAHWRSAS